MGMGRGGKHKRPKKTLTSSVLIWHYSNIFFQMSSLGSHPLCGQNNKSITCDIFNKIKIFQKRAFSEQSKCRSLDLILCAVWSTGANIIRFIFQFLLSLFTFRSFAIGNGNINHHGVYHQPFQVKVVDFTAHVEVEQRYINR